MSEMKIAVQTLNTDYLNSHFKGAISKNEPDKNIEDLNIFISDGKLNVLWKDCDNSHWKKTYIAKLKNQIPSSAFENAIVESYDVKSSHKDFPFVDSNIKVDTLYCYRIFTEFDNSDQLYSGFKNIFFVYVYDPIECDKPHIGDDVIAASMILQDEEHKFVTDKQISDWDNKMDKDKTYTKDEIIELLDDQSNYVVTETQNGMMTPEMLLKLSLLENYTHPLTHPVDMITGLSNVATSGDYNDLTNKPVLADVATSGNYNDLVGTPNIPDLSDLSPVSISGDYRDLTNKPNLADIATTGSYNDLVDKPNFTDVAFSGDYNDLLNKPDIPDSAKFANVARTGDYNDLTNKPVLSNIATSGDYDDLLNKPDLKTVATSGDYNDLLNKPVIPTLADVATSGDYNDLTNKPNIPNFTDVAITGSYYDLTDKPNFADVAFSGSYNDLVDKPIISGSTANLSAVATSGDYNDLSNKPVLADVATSGDYRDLINKPNLADVATSGSYNDLVDKPDIPDTSSLAKVATSNDYNDLDNKPTYSAVATTGSYTDLTNKPSIPTVLKGSGTYNGSAGTTISIPEQDSTDYYVSLTNTSNPGGNLGEVYIDKTVNGFTVYNSGTANTTFEYLLIL